jgi:hypothetical protein
MMVTLGLRDSADFQVVTSFVLLILLCKFTLTIGTYCSGHQFHVSPVGTQVMTNKRFGGEDSN